MRRLFSNPGYKLLALSVALLAWGVSHSTSDVERGFDVPIVIRDVPDDLVVTDQSTDEVNLRVAGTRAALSSLSPADLEYPLEIAGGKPGVMTFEVDAETLELPRGAKVVSRSPSRIEIELTRRGTRAVEVRPILEGEVAEGYELRAVEVDPPRVRISGAQPEVLRLKDVATETIDVSGAQQDVEREVKLSLGGRNLWLEEEGEIRVRVRVVPLPPPPVEVAPETSEPVESTEPA